ncbi:MAG: hypothetical protein R6X02_07410 [Enhygromyxa sp.]
MDLRIRYRSEGEMVAELGPLFLRVINGVATTYEDVERLVATLDRMLTRWPLVGVLVVVEHGSPSPSPEIRRRVDEELRRYGDRIVIGYAFLGLGFWTVDAREWASERAASLGVPVFVTTDLPELARRASFELVGVDPGLVVQGFERLRAALGLVNGG